jgi:hypothetical protein
MSTYNDFLVANDLTEEFVSAISNDASGYVVTDDEVYVAPSTIHGEGVFAKQAFKQGDAICMAQTDGLRTQGGRFTNHAEHPNAIMVKMPDGNLVLMALQDVAKDDEITLDYNQAYEVSDAANIRKKVLHLEKMIQQQEQIDCPVTHHFAPNVYAREMFIPAGTVLTGAVHKTAHLSMLVKGKVRVITDDEAVDLTAPATVLSGVGAKRAIYAYEDAIWTTIHATTETDVDKLVEELTESTAEELLGGSKNVQQLNCVARQQIGS